MEIDDQFFQHERNSNKEKKKMHLNICKQMRKFDFSLLLTQPNVPKFIVIIIWICFNQFINYTTKKNNEC